MEIWHKPRRAKVTGMKYDEMMFFFNKSDFSDISLLVTRYQHSRAGETIIELNNKYIII